MEKQEGTRTATFTLSAHSPTPMHHRSRVTSVLHRKDFLSHLMVHLVTLDLQARELLVDSGHRPCG